MKMIYVGGHVQVYDLNGNLVYVSNSSRELAEHFGWKYGKDFTSKLKRGKYYGYKSFRY